LKKDDAVYLLEYFRTWTSLSLWWHFGILDEFTNKIESFTIKKAQMQS